jgi:SAM-dependent methyltransferase
LGDGISIQRLLNAKRRAQGLLSMWLGRISATEPLSTSYGYDRGMPIDRYYIDKFLQAHAGDIRGRVLEVGESSYSRRLGGDRITRQDVLHVHSGNPEATIIGDVADPSTLPEGQFDCILMLQTLQLVLDVEAAVANVRRALRPGGVALLTVSGLTPICDDEWRDTFYWMFTSQAIRRLLGKHFDEEKIEVRGFGNLYAATAFLHGAAVQEVSKKKLDQTASVPDYSIVVAARAVA